MLQKGLAIDSMMFPKYERIVYLILASMVTLPYVMCTEQLSETPTASEEVIDNLDKEAPQITCPAKIVSVTDVPTAVVTWVKPTTSDNSGHAFEASCTHKSGGHYPVGVSEVICETTDRNGNEAHCAFLIIVIACKELGMEFACPNSNECYIPCDYKRDCDDGSDERNCTCDYGQFECHESNRCIPNDLVCNNRNDCGNNENERDCNFHCIIHGAHFKCPKPSKPCTKETMHQPGQCFYECYNAEDICDYKFDCYDGWDERNCNCKDLQCPQTNECYTFGDICDFKFDCYDGWDERNCTNITTPVCSRHHLCQNKDCTSDSNGDQFCHCDRACTFYNDCCIDYAEVCPDDEAELFHQIVASRGVSDDDVQCVDDYEAGYWMVTTCNNKNLGIVKDRCENPICNDSLTNIPVMDSLGITYRNLYCAICHKVNMSEMAAWEARFTCPSESQPFINQCSDQSHCSLSLHAPTDFTTDTAPRKCQLSVISSCPDTMHGPPDKCEDYTAKVKYKGQIYKNAHCLRCREKLDGFSLRCENNFPEYVFQRDAGSFLVDAPDDIFIPTPVPPKLFSYSMLLNFNLPSKSGLQISLNRQETVLNCNRDEVFALRGHRFGCVKLFCSDGMKLQEGQCVPDVIHVPCNGGNTSTTARFVVKNVTCLDQITITGLERFLFEMFHVNMVNKDHEANLIKDSIQCSSNSSEETTVDYTIFSNEESLIKIKNRLNALKNNVDKFSEILHKIEGFEVTRSCLSANADYKCDDFTWLPDGEYKMEKTNTSYKVYVNKTATWIVADGVNFRIGYEKEYPTSKVTFGIQVCHTIGRLSCPLVEMNMSDFDVSNSTHFIRYLHDGRILKPHEYDILPGSQLWVCNFFNQSGHAVVDIAIFFKYSNTQSIISVIGTTFSLLAIALTLLTYSMFADLRNRASYLIMNLVSTLFMAQCLILFGARQTQNEGLCATIAAIAHYAWLTTFAWMNALAFDLDKTFGNRGNMQRISTGSNKLVRYMLYAYGLPFIVILPCVALHFCQCTRLNFRYGSDNSCWISDGTANLVTFGVPGAVFLLCNIVFFGHTVKGIRATKKDTARVRQDESLLKKTTKELGIYSKIASFMGFTWIFGYIAAFTDVEALWYIYIILNSLQGVLIFLSFICNRRVAILWRKKLHTRCHEGRGSTTLDSKTKKTTSSSLEMQTKSPPAQIGQTTVGKRHELRNQEARV